MEDICWENAQCGEAWEATSSLNPAPAAAVKRSPCGGGVGKPNAALRLGSAIEVQVVRSSRLRVVPPGGENGEVN